MNYVARMRPVAEHAGHVSKVHMVELTVIHDARRPICRLRIGTVVNLRVLQVLPMNQVIGNRYAYRRAVHPFHAVAAFKIAAARGVKHIPPAVLAAFDYHRIGRSIIERIAVERLRGGLGVVVEQRLEHLILHAEGRAVADARRQVKLALIYFTPAVAVVPADYGAITVVAIHIIIYYQRAVFKEEGRRALGPERTVDRLRDLRREALAQLSGAGDAQVLLGRSAVFVLHDHNVLPGGGVPDDSGVYDAEIRIEEQLCRTECLEVPGGDIIYPVVQALF